MKSGGPWNFRGLRPQAREAAREAARRSGMSVGEWLNTVIRSDQDVDDDERRRRRPSDEDRHHRDRDLYGAPPRRRERNPYRDEDRYDRELRRRDPEDQPRRPKRRDQERAVARVRDEIRETARDVAHREVARTRQGLGEVHARLDQLSQQLERLASTDMQRRTAAPPVAVAEPVEYKPPLTGAPPPRRRNPAGASLSIDEAVAEIAERQRALDGGSAARSPLPAREPSVDFSGLEQQLRQITSRIDALQPAADIEKAINAVRNDLNDIGRQLTEALPRRAVESLEIEIKALADRIDHSRQSGGDGSALAGLEKGLAEVREALRRLTPAENLVGFEDAVNALSQKVDMIAAKEDPRALQQLEDAIGGLRGVVSHVASNDALTNLAENVRMLSAQVDGIANSAATGHAVSALEQRLDNLAAALNASSEAGHAVPRDLEKLLAGLIEKLEWVQLTHTDHAALAHLEDRIATLVKRFDASEARFSQLEAVERGLADLLVHIEQMRGGNGAGVSTTRLAPAAADMIEREVAEIKQSERRTQDSLEAFQGAVEQVVDRLATIESGLNRDTGKLAAPPVPLGGAELEHEAEAVESAAAEQARTVPAVTAPPPAAAARSIQPSAPRAAAARQPIDPNLPPDHPLEPGSAAGRSRPMPSAAERVAASEAAIGSAKPPIIADSGRPNFIEAARRAAQAAAWEPSGQQQKGEDAEAGGRAKSNLLSQRMHKLIVALTAVLILIGSVRVATRFFQDTGPAGVPQAQVPPAAADRQAAGAVKQTVPPPLPQASPKDMPASTPAAKPGKPGRQSLMGDGAGPTDMVAALPPAGGAEPGRSALASPDVTGALPQLDGEPGPPPVPARPATLAEDKLPATIGDPALRAAALTGNPAAAYEVATRFAEGHGVLQNSEEAARWLERAAGAGLAPAQFRLGGLYEKGIGVKKDLVRARELYLAAAQKGNGKAMHNLAVLYAEGVDGPPDYNNAAKWFLKAAAHGVEDSEYNLAILYARGIGVDQNFAESYKWFALAAIQGDHDAAKKREEVATHLDAQALAAAQLAVKTWKPEPQPEDAVTVKVPTAWEAASRISPAPKPKPRPAAHYMPGLGAALNIN